MPRSARLLWLIPAALMAGCSSTGNPSFDQHWKDTAMPVNANPAALMAGKWEGTWQSDSNAYEGHMRGIITFSGTDVKDKEQVQVYEANFELQLFQFIPYTDYTVTFTANKLPDGRIHFTGKKDLGYYVGGIYFYDGYIYPDKDLFYCDYNSDKDCGTFKMRRLIQSLQKDDDAKNR